MLTKTLSFLLCLALVGGLSMGAGVTGRGLASAAAQGPTGITLLSFEGQALEHSVLLTWETASEIGNAGFVLWRSDTPGGSLAQLAVVPSQAPGGNQGFFYTYEDLTVQAGETYEYWLEDIALYGGSSLHGPVTVYFTGPTAVTLTSLQARSVAAAAPGMVGGLAALGGLVAAGGAALARRQRRQSASAVCCCPLCMTARRCRAAIKREGGFFSAM